MVSRDRPADQALNPIFPPKYQARLSRRDTICAACRAATLLLSALVPAIVDEHHFRQKNRGRSDPEQQTSGLLIGLAGKTPVVQKRIGDAERVGGFDVV